MDQQIVDAINQQIQQELTASHEYLAMAARFEDENLPGMAAWMRKQSNEERDHAIRLFDYLLDRGAKVKLGSIGEPKGTFESPLAVFELSYKLEQENTASIHRLFGLAREKNDYATMTHLQWFIDEQVEEEKWCQDHTGLLKRVGDDATALLFADKEIGNAAAAEAAAEGSG
jgi:ferritin